MLTSPKSASIRSPAPVKAALQNLGAYSGGRLPSLEGFIKLEGVHLEEYQRPFYEYKLELVPSSTNKTLVRVRAHVTAWQGALEANDSGYRTLESNGRLEADLLDRLKRLPGRQARGSSTSD